MKKFTGLLFITTCIFLIFFSFLAFSLPRNPANNNNDIVTKRLNPSGVYKSVEYLNTNRDIYYFNETINISACWNVGVSFPYPMGEEFFFQVQIYQDFDLIWASEMFNETGNNIQKNLSVNILQDINISLTNRSDELVVTLFYHYFEITYGQELNEFHNNKTITVVDIWQPEVFFLEIERDVFYDYETISLDIKASWKLDYDSEIENTLARLQIREKDTLLWEYINNQTGIINKTFSITFPNLEFNITSQLEVSFLFEYESLVREINYSLRSNLQPIKVLKNGSLEVKFLELDRNVFYTYENISLDTSWDLQYDPENEVSRARLQIRDNKTILWDFISIQTGTVNKTFSIPISSLGINKTSQLEISFLFEYESLVREINYSLIPYEHKIWVLKQGSVSNTNLMVNKLSFFDTETVSVEGKWDLTYNQPYEMSYVQLLVFDNVRPLWNSSKISQIGSNLTKLFEIPLGDLDLNSTIQLYFYYSLDAPFANISVEAFTLVANISIARRVQSKPPVVLIGSVGVVISGVGVSGTAALFLRRKKREVTLEDITIEL